VLLVADPLTAAGMQKVEVGSRSSAAYRRIGFDRNRSWHDQQEVKHAPRAHS
jgi:hypothetical protein